MIISRLPSGGGGSKELHGAVISVTFGDRFTGSSCELLKGSESIKTVVITSTHLIEFKDILDVGTYTVKLLADSAEYTKEVEITAEDILYKETKSVSFSGANISVLVGDSLIGATTTISFGGVVLKSETMPSTKTLLFEDLLSVGDYEVTCTKDTLTRTETVALTQENIEAHETASVEFTGASINVSTDDTSLVGSVVELYLSDAKVGELTFTDTLEVTFGDIQVSGTYTAKTTLDGEIIEESTIVETQDVVNKNVIIIVIATTANAYINGDERVAFTGGWDEGDGSAYGSQSSGVKKSISKLADHIAHNCSNQDRGYTIQITRKEIDFSKYKKIYIELTVNRQIGLFIKNHRGAGINGTTHRAFFTQDVYGSSTKSVQEIDISSVNESAYLSVEMWTTTATSGIYANIYRIWLE